MQVSLINFFFGIQFSSHEISSSTARNDEITGSIMLRTSIGLCVAWKNIHVKMSSTRPHMSMHNVTIHLGVIAWASCKNGKKTSAAIVMWPDLLLLSFLWHYNAGFRKQRLYKELIVNFLGTNAYMVMICSLKIFMKFYLWVYFLWPPEVNLKRIERIGAVLMCISICVQ